MQRLASVQRLAIVFCWAIAFFSCGVTAANGEAPTSWMVQTTFVDSACTIPDMVAIVPYGECLIDYDKDGKTAKKTSSITTASTDSTSGAVTLTFQSYSDSTCSKLSSSSRPLPYAYPVDKCVPGTSGKGSSKASFVYTNPIGKQPLTLIGSQGFRTLADCQQGSPAAISYAYGQVAGVCRPDADNKGSTMYTATGTDGYKVTFYSDTSCQIVKTSGTITYDAKSTCVKSNANLSGKNDQLYTTRTTMLGSDAAASTAPAGSSSDEPTQWVMNSLYSDPACSQLTHVMFNTFGECVVPYKAGKPGKTSTITTLEGHLEGSSFKIVQKVYSDLTCTKSSSVSPPLPAPTAFDTCIAQKDRAGKVASYSKFGKPVSTNPIGTQPQNLVASYWFRSLADCQKGTPVSQASGQPEDTCLPMSGTDSKGIATKMSYKFTNLKPTGYTTIIFSDDKCKKQLNTMDRTFSDATKCQINSDLKNAYDNTQLYSTDVVIMGAAQALPPASKVGAPSRSPMSLRGYWGDPLPAPVPAPVEGKPTKGKQPTKGGKPSAKPTPAPIADDGIFDTGYGYNY